MAERRSSVSWPSTHVSRVTSVPSSASRIAFSFSTSRIGPHVRAAWICSLRQPRDPAYGSNPGRRKAESNLEALEGTDVTRLTWVEGQETLDLRLGHPPPPTTSVHAVRSPPGDGRDAYAARRRAGRRCDYGFAVERPAPAQTADGRKDVHRQLAVRRHFLPFGVARKPALRRTSAPWSRRARCSASSRR